MKEIPERELYAGISPLNPNHPCYGICPECDSNNTMVRDNTATRICLTCGNAEDFSNNDIAQVAWRPCNRNPAPIINKPSNATTDTYFKRKFRLLENNGD